MSAPEANNSSGDPPRTSHSAAASSTAPSATAAGGSENKRHGNKRKSKYISSNPHHSGASHDPQHAPKKANPTRGGPAILWTCETGLERKCRHQALEILQHYYDQHQKRYEHDSSPTLLPSRSSQGGSRETAAEKKLTLEEELSQLKNQAPANGKLPFSVYETKCRGTVIMLCTAPEAFLVPPVKYAALKVPCAESSESLDQQTSNEESVSNKRSRSDTANDPMASDDSISKSPTKVSSDDKTSNCKSAHTVPWDPVDTVRAVIQDLRDSNQRQQSVSSGGDRGMALLSLASNDSHAVCGSGLVIPASRFVTRMIPLQATCYASIGDLKVTFSSLLDWYMKSTGTDSDRLSGSCPSSPSASASPSSPTTTLSKTTNTTTYMVQSKRRHCDNLTSKDVINCVAELVPSSWKVDLRQPHVVVWVEICTTLAGLSIVPSSTLQQCFNFNLLQARTASVASE